MDRMRAIPRDDVPIRTQNTNKTLRAICQRQKAMVRAYLSKKNEITSSKRLIYLVIALSLPL